MCCNYETERDLLINGVTLKACDFETEDVVERKGTRKPTNRASRRKATARAKAKRKRNMITVYGYDPIIRGENGKTFATSDEEFESSIVATKKSGKSAMTAMYKKMDRRKLRHNGKMECNNYIPEDFDDLDDFDDEEIYEYFPKLDDYYDDSDFDNYYDEEELMAEEISCLKREINLYKDFIGEFGLNKLYETWLAQNV